MRALSDEELLRLTPKRPAAFDVFYVRHERLVVAYFRRRTTSAELAVDVTAGGDVRRRARVCEALPAR